MVDPFMKTSNSYEKLKQAKNKEITIKGIISTIPWQHTIGSIKEFSYIEYFDLEDSFQTVIYSKSELPKGKLLEIKGTVTEIKGRSKRPKDEQNENYREYHIIVREFKEV